MTSAAWRFSSGRNGLVCFLALQMGMSRRGWPIRGVGVDMSWSWLLSGRLMAESLSTLAKHGGGFAARVWPLKPRVQAPAGVRHIV